jgi:hypothetical protein
MRVFHGFSFHVFQSLVKTADNCCVAFDRRLMAYITHMFGSPFFRVGTSSLQQLSFFCFPYRPF